MSFSTQNGLEAVRHLRSRASCRTFSDRPVDDGLLREILSAALHAASGGNLQPWSVIVERDREKAQKLCDLCGGQKFIADAPVNLIFLLDWHRYQIYAAQKDAPFACDHSYMHFLIGLEDVICAAQTVETACHLVGLGSCYVGSSNHCGAELAEMYSLPQLTYPVVILSIGWPRAQPPVAPKLDPSVVIFEGGYPALTPEQIFDAYETKLQGRTLPLPAKELYRGEMLDNLRRSLLTTFDPERTEAILKTADEQGFINETQRRFGLHYHARDMYETGGRILEMMRSQGLRPFDALEKKGSSSNEN